jgi:hypothetical protein
MSARLTHVFHDYVEVEYDGRHLFRYVYEPQMPAEESPKPYFHPLRTLGGNLLTNFRPHDHLWHKGMAMTMAHLSGQNFWGGKSYVHGQGYVQLPNNGRMEHQAWEELRCDATEVTLQERLTWLSYEGEPWLDEQRRMVVGAIDIVESSWSLDFSTSLRNVRREPLVFGSPTTHGRPLAGYGGLFWRGPRSFFRGTVLAAGNLEGPEIMGQSASWLAYIGSHDGVDGPDGTSGGGQSTLVFVDHPGNVRYPNKWFVRSDPFAAVSFAFTFDEELTLEPGETLALRHRMLFADGAWTRDQIEARVASDS